MIADLFNMKESNKLLIAVYLLLLIFCTPFLSSYLLDTFFEANLGIHLVVGMFLMIILMMLLIKIMHKK